MLDLWWALTPLMDVLLRRWEDPERHREDHVETEERLEGCTYKTRDTKDHHNTRILARSLESSTGQFLTRASRKSQPCPHLDFRLQASRTTRGKSPVVISHQLATICHDTLWKLICEHHSIHLSSHSSILTCVVKTSLLKSLQPGTNAPCAEASLKWAICPVHLVLTLFLLHMYLPCFHSQTINFTRLKTDAHTFLCPWW